MMRQEFNRKVLVGKDQEKAQCACQKTVLMLAEHVHVPSLSQYSITPVIERNLVSLPLHLWLKLLTI